MISGQIFSNPIVSHCLSFLIGIAGSYMLWWWLNHKWIPQIDFSGEIARYKVENGNFLYVCAFENIGKRDILDVEVIVRFGVKNFNGADSWIFFSVKTNSSRIPVLHSKRRCLVRIFDQRESIEYIDSPPKGLKNLISKCTDIEDIFKICPVVTAELHVFGYDSFSGARRHYCSSPYKCSDIRTGKFKGLVVVKPS